LSEVDYDDNFYQRILPGSKSSARIVIPLIKDLLDPKSVLDVGCGNGTWAGIWIASGVEDVLGVDGGYVNSSILDIPQDNFHAWDLTQPLDLGRKFDLATCLEVAEHIPAESAGTLVQSLVKHADAVAFSAAVPRQDGVNHINLQWPSYWAALFRKSGFEVYDPIRAVIWDNHEVAWWYRQNILLFVADSSPLANRLTPITGPIDIVHPELLETWAKPAANYLALREKLRASGPGRIIRTLRNSLARR
jgi:SAM-dependent methyltransferase